LSGHDVAQIKAVMSPPYIAEWKQLFSTGRWDHKLELSQEVMNTPSDAT